MIRNYRGLGRGSRFAILVAAFATLATTAPAFAAATLPKAGEPIGAGDLAWIAGAGVLLLLVGFMVRRRMGGG